MKADLCKPVKFIPIDFTGRGRLHDGEGAGVRTLNLQFIKNSDTFV